jgi:xylose isomerase
MTKQRFGAGIRHFASNVDRYATDRHRPPHSLLEMIGLAGHEHPRVVDITVPCPGGGVSLGALDIARAALFGD